MEPLPEKSVKSNIVRRGILILWSSFLISEKSAIVLTISALNVYGIRYMYLSINIYRLKIDHPLYTGAISSKLNVLYRVY